MFRAFDGALLKIAHQKTREKERKQEKIKESEI